METKMVFLKKTTRERVVGALGDKEYRDAYVSAHMDLGVAFQIRANRLARGWSQKELGQRAGGVCQGKVSRLECSDDRMPTFAMLKRIASALDVALIVRFVPFSELVDWTTSLGERDNVSPSFGEDGEGLSPGDD